MAYDAEPVASIKEPGEDDLARMITWFDDWESATAEARRDSERDEDYYDGMQWTSEEVKELNDRGQPVITKNRIFKKINFLLGTEIRNRTDPKALPRSMAKHGPDAEAITDAVRYVLDADKFKQTSSKAWRGLLIPGVAASVVEHEVQEAKIKSPRMPKYKICVRHVPWDRIWWDLRSREPDFSDAKYLGISTWWHLEDAISHYSGDPHRSKNYEEVLKTALTDSRGRDDTHDDKPTWTQGEGDKKRIRVQECYYLHVDERTKKSTWYTAHYTKSGFVVPPMPTGHKDEFGNDICPMVATSGFVTRQGVRYGLVRNMVGPQDEINKRSSKMLHHLSVDRIVTEESAISDVDEVKAERAKPDGVTRVQNGAITNGKIIFEKGLDVAQGHHVLLQEAKQDIDTIGPEIPAIGSIAGSSSGRALQQRQMIGALEIAPLEDRHKQYQMEIYKRCWWKVKALWTGETWFRTRNDPDREGYRFVGLNRRMTKAQRLQELLRQQVPPQSALSAVDLPEDTLEQLVQVIAQQAQAAGAQIPPQAAEQMALKQLLASPPMQEEFLANDVAAVDIDIVFEEVPDVAIVQQEEAQELREVLEAMMASGNPDPATQKELVKLIIEAGQLRNKKRLLGILNQPPDPQQVQMQQQQMMLTMQELAAKVKDLEAKAALNQAKLAGEQADAQATAMLATTESQLNQAQAMKAMAEAGAVTGERGMQQ